MGFAKYMEDNEDIRTERSNSDYSTWSAEHRLEIVEKPAAISNEFKNICIKKIQVSEYINFDNKLLNFILDNALREYIQNQIFRLKILEDKYYNRYFDTKFGPEIRFSEKRIKEKEIRTCFHNELKTDFLERFNVEFTRARNKSVNDAIRLRGLYTDLNEYLSMFFPNSIARTNPIEYFRYCILNHQEKQVICPNCKKYTFKDYSFCIYCNNDFGGSTNGI